MTIDISDESYQAEVLESDIPVLLDFWADWCMPCKMIEPVMESLAQEYAGQLKVGGLDVTKYEQLAGRLDVVSIPTLILYKDGQEVDRLVGAAPKEKIVEMIKPHL